MTYRLRGHLYLGALLCLLSTLLVGCGGGGGGSASSTKGTPIIVTIDWAARARSINAPSSALSAVVTLKQASPDGTDFNFTIDRNSAPAGYTQTYTSTNLAKPGTWPLTVNFYAEADGAGAVVGTASATVTLNSNGAGIGNIVTTGAIASVALTPGQSVPLGQTAFLTFTAYDANNAVVAISPGTGFFTLVSGGQYVAVNNGIAQGLALGAATVTVTVDGKTSVPGAVSTVGTINALQTVELSALYGEASVRIKGLTSTTATVSVTVGGVASTAVAVGYTDANAPSATASEGGAVYFLVPYGLKAGSQNLVLTINGAAMPPYPVTVSDTNPFAVFILGNNQVFVAELRQDKAPKTVANFVGLATGTKKYTDPCTNLSSNAPLYNGTTFWRCIPNFVFQGGDPLSKCLPAGSSQIGTGSIGFTIPFEVTGLTNTDGALAMARGSDLNSASSQFFIDNGAQSELNTTLDASGNPTGGYAVFGSVVEGLNVAKAITLTTDAQGNPLVPTVTPTTLTSVYITGKIDSP